ncbi:putative phospholipase B-like 2 [Ixodes scapularis]
METTIDNNNDELWKKVTPIDTVPTSIRNMVASRLAITGKDWTNIFAKFNSGTYNNQWMVLDYKLFDPTSKKLPKNLLWILEQMPGYTMSKDVTSVLQKQGYWASYNSPYFQEIIDKSGFPALVKKYGDWYSYAKTPRALIFKRDQKKAVDISSVMKLLRYNDFVNDPLSRCTSCDPPHNAANAISARGDLNPANGTYPFKALSHLAYGGTDAKAKKLHSEDLLVEVNTKKQSEALLRLTNIVDVEVSVSPHRTLNTVRGVLSEEAFLYTSEDELLEGLKSSGVVDVRRIVFRKNGENIPSKHVILTFERRALPETVKAGYLNCRIRPYIPNPQRCFRCQRFGHGSRSCRGKETCAKCGNEGHVSDGCEAEAHCANCRGPHPAYYRSCPLWKQEKDILAVKVKENLSYADAKKRFSFLSKGGYAEVVRRGPAPRSETKATQVSPEILVADLKAPSPQQRQHAAPLGKDGPAIAVPALPFKTVARGFATMPPYSEGGNHGVFCWEFNLGMSTGCPMELISALALPPRCQGGMPGGTVQPKFG